MMAGSFTKEEDPGMVSRLKVQAFIYIYDAIGFEERFHHPGVVRPACAWDFRHSNFAFVEETPFIDGGPNARVMVKEFCVVLEFERSAYGFDPMEVVCWLVSCCGESALKHAPICPLTMSGNRWFCCS